MGTFRQAMLSRDFVVTAELPLNPSMRLAALHESIDALKPVVDAIQVGDNEYADGHISPLAVARIALDRGVDPVLHLACRDRNRIALQSEILGAAALGVTSLVLKRGDKLPTSLKGRVKGVFDTRTAQLFSIATRVTEAGGLAIGAGFYLGTYATAINPRDNWQAKRVSKKIESGAKFLLTRPALDLDLIASYAKKLVAKQLTHRALFVAGVPLITSPAELGDFLGRYPGAPVADRLAERLAKAADPRAEGIAILAETLAALAATPGVSGANVLFAGDAPALVEAIATGLGPRRAADERASQRPAGR